MDINNKKLIALALAASLVTACGGGGDDDDDNPGDGNINTMTDLEKAQAMVDDLRNLKLLFTEDLANEQGTGSAQQFIESFDVIADALGQRDYTDALDAIIDTSAHYVDSIGDGTGVQTAQFETAYQNYLNDEDESDPGLLGDISGDITYDTNTNTVTVDATVGDIAADLVFDVTDDGTVTQASATLQGTLTSTSNQADQITINPGSTLSLVLDSGHEVKFNTSVDMSEISQFNLSLDAQVSTEHNGEAASFAGSINYEIVRGATTTESGGPIAMVSAYGLTGEVSVGAQSFDTAFDVNFNNAESFSPVDGEEGPDTNNWIDADFSLMFETIMNGDDVQVTWTAERDTFNTAGSTLSFAFGNGTTLIAQGNGERTQIVEDGDDIFDTTLTITHNLGAQAVLDLDNEKFDIIVNGNDMGDIVELDDDTIKVTFSDNTFETL